MMKCECVGGSNVVYEYVTFHAMLNENFIPIYHDQFCACQLKNLEINIFKIHLPSPSRSIPCLCGGYTHSVPPVQYHFKSNTRDAPARTTTP